MYEQSCSFSFEAAHELSANVANTSGHPYARVHGHSFVATLTLRAELVGPEGWIMDYAGLREICQSVRDRLDHQFLNSIPGLERPTLENIAAWVFNLAARDASALWRVEIARPTLNERVAFYAQA